MWKTYGATLTKHCVSRFPEARTISIEYSYFMLKAIRRLAAIMTLFLVAIKSAISLVTWIGKQEEDNEALWMDEEELEEVE